jgi:hypothetical protein
MKVFKKNYHYGIIPGCKKPSLLLPGAELICRGLKLFDDYITEEKIEDWDKGFFYYKMKCYLYITGTDIKVVTGLGSCNSRENKYLHRWVNKKDIPPGIDPSTLEQVEKEGQYGKYIQYKVENTNPCDLANTIFLMAKKRALVNGGKSIAGLSDIFTQDMEDYYDPDSGEKAKNKSTNGNGKKETPQAPAHNGVSRKAVDLVKASVEFFGHPDLKEYVKNNYKTTSSIEFKDYFYNKATEAELKAFESFLESLKTKKLNEEYRKSLEEANKEQEKQTDKQRIRFHALCGEMEFDRDTYLNFALMNSDRKELTTTADLTKAEMEKVLEILQDEVYAKRTYDAQKAGEKLVDEFCSETEESITLEEARLMAEAGDAPF